MVETLPLVPFRLFPAILLQLLIWQLLMQSCVSAQESVDAGRMGLRVTIHTDTTVTHAEVIPRGKKTRISESVLYHWYSSNHIHVTRGGFGGKLLHGKYAQFQYPDKNLLEQGEFWKGKKNGVWKSWYSHGEVKQRVRWKNGKLHGRFNEYNKEGEIIRSGRYRKNKLHGLLKTQYGLDSLEIRHFRNGRPLSRNRGVFKLLSRLGGQFKSKIISKKRRNRAVNKLPEQL